MNHFKIIPFLVILAPATVLAQGMKMSDKLIVCNRTPERELTDQFKTAAIEIISAIKNDQSVHLFQADRGNKKGEFLLLTDTHTSASNSSNVSDPFAEFSKIMVDNIKVDGKSFTTYELIGADKFGALPNAGILGIHYIKIRPDKAVAFEQFVIERLHPKVGHLFPDMQMMYYKTMAGNNKREYLLIFSIASPAARDKYWPEGKPETELLKNGFKPLKDLAAELELFLVKDSYLPMKSGGAAAIFESMVWTDFIHSDFLK